MMGSANDVRLLVLDDDPAIGTLVRVITERAGVSCAVTETVHAFETQLDAFQPTHILLDLVMPRIDGMQVVTRLAERRCTAKLILTSGRGARVLDAAARAAREQGLRVAGVVAKPFRPRELREVLAAEDPSAPPVETPVPQAASGWVPSERHFDEALERGEITLHYQPKVRCTDGVVTGVEALARWHHPRMGVISPVQFIPAAEANGRITALTETLLAQAIALLARFTDEAIGALPPSLRPHFTCAVNLSARSLRDDQLVAVATALCETHGVAPERVTFEITESSTLDRPVDSLAALTRMRLAGFELSIDDFGTGFSSMLQLVRLPFSELKVDKSFVGNARHSAESRTVVRSIIELGRSLGLRTVGEGVEDEVTLHLLADMGCDVAQGFHIARALAADDLLRWITGRAS